jgi:outer membrane protein assembly factor BamD
MKFNILLVFSVVFIALSSCSDYQKVVKGDDYEMKVIEADRMYDKGSFTKALTLYEQIYQRYPNTEQGQKAYYRLAKSYFAIEDYYMAGYYYNQFTQRYPSDEKVEDCLFMTAICSVKNSPQPSLDQEETELALNDLQLFVQRFPNSSLVDSCNRTMDRLRFKLESKRFDAVKLYANMSKYRAAVYAAKSFLMDYPQSNFKTEAAFLEFENAYFLGMKSVFSKQKERLEDASEIYARYGDLFTENEMRRKSEKYIEDITNELQYVAERYAFNDISAAFEKSRSSSTQKKVSYLKETLKRYDNFAKQYPESTLLEKAKNVKEKAEKELLNI